MRKASYFLVVLLGMILIMPAQAATSNSTKSTNTTTKNTTSSNTAKSNNTAKSATGTKAQTFADKCTKIQNNLETKLENYGTSQEKHLSVYNNLIDRIDAFVTKASSSDYNTAMLETDLATLKTKVEKFSTDYTEYNTAMAALKTEVCKKKEASFKTDLKKAQTQLKAVHQDAADIREFYKNNIKPDLQSLTESDTTATDSDSDQSESESTSDSTINGTSN